MNHTNAILGHLESGEPITPVEALSKFGCFRLGARIHDLKKAGHVIDRRMIEVKTRDGTARVAEYRMEASSG